jgi:hypothetical protein
MIVLKRTTKTSMDERDPSWTIRRGRPEFWMTWDGTKVRVHPFVESLDATVGFLESPEPMDLGGPVDADSRIPRDKRQYLPWAAAAYLLSLDGNRQDLERAALFLKQFESFIGGSNGSGPNVLPS